MRDEFVRVFEGGVTFGPLYPPGVSPVPMSAWVHKYDPLPACTPRWDEALGVEPPRSGRLPACPDCDSTLRRGAGELSSPVSIVHDTHTAVGDDDRVEQGKLFSRQRIGRGQEFIGWVSGEDNDVERALGEVDKIWLGGRKSVSGQAHLSSNVVVPLPTVERVRPGELVLRLGQPGIFVDEYGRPADAPSSEQLSSLLGTAAHVDRRRMWMRWANVTGWHVASGFPKPAESAAARGSTYVVVCDGEPSNAAVRELCSRGMGLRRIEGFGAVVPGPVTVGASDEGVA
jgi:CRISPR-associated protein Csx10